MPQLPSLSNDYPAAETVSIDLRMTALAYVLEKVKTTYGPDGIALRNVAALVDGVADAVANDDRTTALVRGLRLLSESEVVDLWDMLAKNQTQPPEEDS